MDINDFKELLKRHGLDAAKEATSMLALLKKVHAGKISALNALLEFRDELNVSADTSRIIILTVAKASGIKRSTRVMETSNGIVSPWGVEAGTGILFKGEIDAIADMLTGISVSEAVSILDIVRMRIQKTIIV